MKLRIRGNSIRLRLSRSEVDDLAGRGWVEDSIHFAPRATLTYRLEVGEEPEPVAALDGTTIRVAVPRHHIPGWLAPDQVSIRGEQRLPQGERLKILVEKDFECLNPRADEDASDLFAHPEAQPYKARG